MNCDICTDNGMCFVGKYVLRRFYCEADHFEKILFGDDAAFDKSLTAEMNLFL